ncbi:unnamed protein product, partial [marine sediment metagenome]
SHKQAFQASYSVFDNVLILVLLVTSDGDF